MMLTLSVLIAVMAINVVFGYWRSNTRRLTHPWLLSIHVPVPIALLLRLILLGGSWTLVPVFVGAFAAGQYAGGAIRQVLRKRYDLPLTSFLFADLARATCASLRQK
jgi:hypothetical protein